jgi:hypothetical protein
MVGDGATDATTTLGHRLYLDSGLAEVIGHHLCGRGCSRWELHPFR